jgi:hypothetical protein
MAKIPPPKGKGEPPPPDETVGNLDKAELSHLNFRVRDTFHKDFRIFAIRHNFKSQTELLYELFELGKEKYEGPVRQIRRKIGLLLDAI